MRGNEVRSIRFGMTLDRMEFASILGINVSTVARWEGCPDKVKPDPLHAQILSALQSMDSGARFDLGVRLKAMLHMRGNIATLAELLNTLVAAQSKTC